MGRIGGGGGVGTQGKSLVLMGWAFGNPLVLCALSLKCQALLFIFL
jgi:hypothetical protein